MGRYLEFPKNMTFQKLVLFQSSHRQSVKRYLNVATLIPWTSAKQSTNIFIPSPMKTGSIIQFKNILTCCIPLSSISKQVGSIQSPDITTQHHTSPQSKVDPLKNRPLTHGFWKYWTKSVGSEIVVCNGNM